MTQKTISEPLLDQSPKVDIEPHLNGGTAVAHTQAAISQNDHHGLFDAIPVSLWKEDFSKVKQFINKLHQEGIFDFRAYFNAHPQDVAHCLRLVKVNAVNQAALKLYKASSEIELISSLEKILGPESPTLFKEELILLGEGKTSFECERVNYTLENEKINVLVRWSVAPGFEATLSQVFVSILDLTSQKRAEDQLRKQLQEEELLRQIVAVNPAVNELNAALNSICEKLATFYAVPSVSFTLLDKEAMLADVIGEYLSPELLENNGQVIPLANIVPIDNLIRQKSAEFIPNVQEAPRFEQVGDILQAFDNHSALLVPVAAAEPFQGLLAFDTVQPGEFSQDDIQFIEQVASHIGQMLQRVQMEQKLQKQQDFARQVMNNMGQGLLVLRADRTIEFCNPAFANLVGYEQKELVGRSLMELVKIDTQTAVAEPTEAERAAQKSVRELELVHADGSETHVLLTGVPRNQTIVEDGAICVVTDLSAQKKIEHALAQARDQAIEATRLKSEFLANMSHEIRTPLNAVVGMTSLMLDSPLTPEQQDYAQTIRSSSEVLLALINDILDFSKIEAGKLELEQRPFSVRDCVEEALDVVVTKASEKGLELAYLIEDEVPNEILGDVTRVRQILVNLLNNAIKFTNVGEVVLSVSCGKGECPNPTTGEAILRFSVKDTGIGIPPARLDRLFKSFSQVDASTTRKHGGTGLGLAISKQLAEMMGGQIWVESEYEKGSTFHFTITARPVASKRRVYTQRLTHQLKGKRVLIVDDNQTNCKILGKQTTLWGMVPTAVLSGEEALTLLQKGMPFDLAILDMQMPEMDGMMLAAQIRQLHDKQSLPLVMLSSIGARDEFKETDYFAAFLTKPAKQQSLFETLTAVLSDTAVPHTALPQKLEIDPNMGKNHPLRILLAEDNLVNQKVALRILERMGYRADVAGDGLEVLESLQRQPYDVVLMDVQMPYMDGVEATEQIHDIWPPEEQPDVIAMTANALTGDRERYLMAGMDNYISKPVRIQELMEALAAVTPLSAKHKN